MGIWLSILLSVLPSILAWLMELVAKKGTLKDKQLDKVNKALWYFDQIQGQAVQAGATPGGVIPEVEAKEEEVW